MLTIPAFWVTKMEGYLLDVIKTPTTQGHLGTPPVAFSDGKFWESYIPFLLKNNYTKQRV